MPKGLQKQTGPFPPPLTPFAKSDRNSPPLWGVCSYRISPLFLLAPTEYEKRGEEIVRPLARPPARPSRNSNSALVTRKKMGGKGGRWGGRMSVAEIDFHMTPLLRRKEEGGQPRCRREMENWRNQPSRVGEGMDEEGREGKRPRWRPPREETI